MYVCIIVYILSVYLSVCIIYPQINALGNSHEEILLEIMYKYSVYKDFKLGKVEPYTKLNQMNLQQAKEKVFKDKSGLYIL